MNEESVRLIECFNTFQGEGPDTGRTMLILRFKTCNLKCHWCDTAVKMRISMEAPYMLSDIQKTINEKHSGLLITGGEPTVSRHFNETLMLLNELDYPVANVETNGCQLENLIKATNPRKNVRFIYSPKIFSEKDLYNCTQLTERLLPCSDVYIKVVYEENPLIISYLDWLSGEVDVKDSGKVWLMPEGVTRSDLIRNSEGVFNACEKYKFNFSSRSHIIFGFV
jgi:7-carboxy-7-deazaguanine synthase